MSFQTPLLAPRSGVWVLDPRKAVAPPLSISFIRSAPPVVPDPALAPDWRVWVNDPRKAVAPQRPLRPLAGLPMSSQTRFSPPRSGIRVNVPHKAVAPLLSLASTTQHPSCFPIPASRYEIAGLGLHNPVKAVAPPFPRCPQRSAPHVVPDSASLRGQGSG